MLLTIKVKPAAHLRAAFAKWAIAQTPKVDKCSHNEFCVPPDLFTHMPEDLLIGSLVDGHPYVSPDEDSGQELLGGATPGAFVPIGEGDDPRTYACDLCGRPFPTERGRNTHRRQAHPEGGS